MYVAFKRFCCLGQLAKVRRQHAVSAAALRFCFVFPLAGRKAANAASTGNYCFYSWLYNVPLVNKRLPPFAVLSISFLGFFFLPPSFFLCFALWKCFRCEAVCFVYVLPRALFCTLSICSAERCFACVFVRRLGTALMLAECSVHDCLPKQKEAAADYFCHRVLSAFFIFLSRTNT